MLIEVLEKRNAELTAQVSDLSERLARLERAMSRNSGNSGMPPSADDLPGRKAPEPKPGRGGGKKQGKQPGAPGAHLAWSEVPDDTKPLFPRGACACGRDLADADDLGVVASHQLMDTPAVTAVLTQYDEHAVACRCGRVHAAVPPAGAGEPGTVTYGPNLQAWCVFLLVMHHVPVERCAGIVEALTGTRPSDGFVHSMIARAAKAVRGVSMLIRALVITASVLNRHEGNDHLLHSSLAFEAKLISRIDSRLVAGIRPGKYDKPGHGCNSKSRAVATVLELSRSSPQPAEPRR